MKLFLNQFRNIMAKICDNTSVGMIVWRGGKLLLIERKKFPFAFAPPAGHVDGDPSWEETAKRELLEEVGLETESIKLLIEGRKDNPCRREGGSWHFWKIYQIEASGEIKRSQEETKQAGFYSLDEVRKLGERTKRYLSQEISQEEWEKSPGLEVVWYEWFQELRIL